MPKLFLKAEPGAILANDTLVNLVRGWPALTEKTVAGIHFVQEDSPDDVGQLIAGWMGRWADGGHAEPRWRSVATRARPISHQ